MHGKYSWIHDLDVQSTMDGKCVVHLIRSDTSAPPLGRNKLNILGGITVCRCLQSGWKMQRGLAKFELKPEHLSYNLVHCLIDSSYHMYYMILLLNHVKIK